MNVKAGRRMCCDGDDGATARVEKIAQTSVESHYVQGGVVLTWCLGQKCASHILTHASLQCFTFSLISFFPLLYTMNLSGDMEDASDKILFLNFNQEFSCVSVGTETGYRMYNCDPFGRCYSKCT